MLLDIGTQAILEAAVRPAGLATPRLVAPFFRTIVGTDTYVDQLW